MSQDIDAIALEIAHRAHAVQRDKAGEPYIGHLRRVAGYVDPHNVKAKAAAWLHDIKEDQGYADRDLIEAGLPRDVVEVVDLMTRKLDQDPADYYAAIRANDLAREVKLADLADNTDPRRLAKLPAQRQDKLRRKYAHAYEALGADPSDGDQRRGSRGRVQA
ncbi:HD domain-containing protein [Mycolicibacterium llatzerense]|uniref:HD domain-containing protein n=1 Tax=Mycolicibacterium llatzerense TaxID=280871 RepID=UPI0021B58247|nr:HD domain-containing protein [Mycolicibacterium llatzerense]MCT7371964.1 hypothetical protein [Mycolicibacterium llatzerense]